MPSLARHQSGQTVKLLFIGDSGSGKTGALSSLANAGYKLFILDYDNGLDALRNFTQPDKLSNVEFVTLTDRLKLIGNSMVPAEPPKAYLQGMQLLNHWKYTDKETKELIDHGPVETWGPDRVLVIDSLTIFGQTILRFILQLAGRSGQNPQLQEWGAAMAKQEELAQLLFSDVIKCHVIITAHVTYIEREDGRATGYPSALGSKLPPKIGTYFNTVLLAKTLGMGASAKRLIYTQPQGMVELKNPVSNKVPESFPLATGLADFFKIATKGN